MAASFQKCLAGAGQKGLPRQLAAYYMKRNVSFLKSLYPDFEMDKNTLFKLTQKFDLTEEGLEEARRKRELERMYNDQKFREDRYTTLGPDLAAATFLTARGGMAKFVGKEPWVRKSGVRLLNLPGKFDAGFKVEAIDCSGMQLLYVGLDNLVDLEHLKYINFSNGTFVDDWFLARLQIYSNSLEFLDVSGCKNITACGILALHHLRKLKVLKMNDCPNVRNQELIALLLETHIPDLQVIGVDKSTDILPKDIAEKLSFTEDMKEVDFQTLTSRFLRLGDILDDEGRVISSSIGQGNYNPKVNDGCEVYIDTDNVKQEELERRLEGKRLNVT